MEFLTLVVGSLLLPLLLSPLIVPVVTTTQVIPSEEETKIENGSGNPTIKLLQRLANGLNMNLKISFEPKSAAMI